MSDVAIAAAMTSLESTSTVSWQSAFWALVPIALNSMTQPAGNLFGFPSVDQGFGLRSSPIVCACDALHFFFCLTSHTIAYRSPREAMKLTLKTRFQNRNAEEQSSGAKLQQNPVFRVVLFTLGALPQIVKLFSMEGILVTRMIASLYFGSFLVLEIGVYFSREMEQDLEADSRGSNPVLQGDNAQKGLEWKLRVGVTAFSNRIVLYPLGVSAYEVAKTIGPRLWPYAAGLCILATTPLFDKVWFRRDKVTLAQALILFPNVVGIFLSLCVLMPIYNKAKSTNSGASFGLYISAGTLVASGICVNAYYWTKTISRLDMQSKEIEVGLGFFEVVFNMGTALLYYAFRYDPSGTFKPSWANQLG